MTRPLLIFAAVFVAAALLVVGYLGGRQTASVSAPAHSPAAAPDSAGKVLYWYDPMVPAQHLDKPGLSPMAMQMVPRHAESGSAEIGRAHVGNPVSNAPLACRLL